MALMESTQRLPVSQEYAPNPMLMNIRVIASSDDFSNFYQRVDH